MAFSMEKCTWKVPSGNLCPVPKAGLYGELFGKAGGKVPRLPPNGQCRTPRSRLDFAGGDRAMVRTAIKSQTAALLHS